MNTVWVVRGYSAIECSCLLITLVRSMIYFCVVLVEKQFGLFECASQWIKSLYDGSSNPSGLVIHHSDNLVPNFFIVVLEFSEGVEYPQNSWDSSTYQLLHIIGKGRLEVLVPKLVFFLQTHFMVLVKSFNDLQGFGKLKLKVRCFHFVQKELDVLHPVVNNAAIQATENLSWCVLTLR